MSTRKSSHRTIFLIVSSGSPLALIASSLRSTSKKPVCPMTRSLHPPMAHCRQRVRFAATWREEFFEVPLSDPNKVNAGRPTVLSLNPKGSFGDWTDSKQAYLIQTGPRPFASTYDRVAGGTSHWLGTRLRFVPNDLKMKSQYGTLTDWQDEYMLL